MSAWDITTAAMTEMENHFRLVDRERPDELKCICGKKLRDARDLGSDEWDHQLMARHTADQLVNVIVDNIYEELDYVQRKVHPPSYIAAMAVVRSVKQE